MYKYQLSIFLLILLFTINNTNSQVVLCPELKTVLDYGHLASYDEFGVVDYEPFIVKVGNYPPVKSWLYENDQARCEGTIFYYMSFDTDGDMNPIPYKLLANTTHIVKTYRYPNINGVYSYIAGYHVSIIPPAKADVNDAIPDFLMRYDGTMYDVRWNEIEYPWEDYVSNPVNYTPNGLTVDIIGNSELAVNSISEYIADINGGSGYYGIQWSTYNYTTSTWQYGNALFPQNYIVVNNEYFYYYDSEYKYQIKMPASNIILRVEIADMNTNLSTSAQINIQANPEVTFVNEIVGTQNYGYLILDENKNDPITSGTYRLLGLQGNYSVRTNELPHIFNWNNTGKTHKHYNWDAIEHYNNLCLNFSISNLQTNVLKSKFQSTESAEIRTIVDGMDLSGVVFQFQDPWFYYSDQNQNWYQNSMFRIVTSPLLMFNNSTNSYGGVFPYQGWPDWQTPYYSIKTGNVFTTQITETGKNHTLYFKGWNAQNAQLEQVGTNPSGFDQKGVVFTNSNAEVSANFKGTQLTNTSTTYENNSQRKFVRANNVLFSVQESVGKVWIEFSRDNGQTWELSNLGSSLFNGAEAKNPSIEFINLDGSTSLILVVAQINNNGDSKIAASLSKITSTTFLELDYEEWANGDGGSFSTNNYPAIAMAGSSLFMISWVVSEGGYSFVDFGVGEIVNDGFGNLSLDYPSQNQDYISSESIIRNISLYSSKPIQIQNQNEFYSCWFAYESEESSQYSRIYVKKFDVGTNYHLNSSNSAEVSSGSGYTQNYNPSIVAFGEGARVCWLGTRMYVDEKEEESPTEGGTPVYEHRVIFKDPSYYRYWNFIKTNGNTAHSPSINKTDGNTAYIFGWSEDDGSERVFANNSLNSIYTMVSTTGKDLQLSNGASTSSMYVNTFNSSSLPYSFASTIDINSFYGIQKSSGISISSGREGIVYKDSVQFYFCMGDISVDGEPVEFVELPDTLNVNNQIVINQSVVSKPFDLTNNSNFLYGVQYGIANPSTVTGILNNGKSVGFKVELIDAESNAVIGVFDDVTYNENSLNNYDNLFYQVNTSGIGSRTVKLRLQINENLNADYSISDKYSKTTMFNKQSLKEVSYRGSLAVNDYALNQNYPNPFNPGTVISYQLVAGGQVSLKVYDILGKEIVTLVDKEQESGRYQVTFDASKLASGIYICRIIAGDFVKTIKMSLVK